MRTSISIDDRLFEQVRRRARQDEMSVSAWIARVVDDALKRGDGPPLTPPFRLISVSGGGTYSGVDLDRPRGLIVAEDEERFGRRRSDE